jgi:hypothetical protein
MIELLIAVGSLIVAVIGSAIIDPSGRPPLSLLGRGR